MNPYEPQPYLPPLYGGPDAQPLWDPSGPDGRLVDASDPYGRTIGEIAQSEGAPLHGWVRGPEGTAMPAPLVSGTPPPEAIAAMQQQTAPVAPTAMPDPDLDPVNLLLLME